MSRIFWNGNYLGYPWGVEVVRKLGPVELTPRSLASYLRAAVKPKGKEDDLEKWVSDHFGERLYNADRQVSLPAQRCRCCSPRRWG